MHTSVPANPLLAEPLYLAGYIERMGTGTSDMVQKSVAAGLNEPKFIQAEDFRSIIYRPTTDQVKVQVTMRDIMQDTMQDAMQVTMQVEQLLIALDGVLSREELQDRVGINNRDYFRKSYLKEALQLELVEMTIPDKPNSKNQKYCLTKKGKSLQTRLKKKN